jgi:hypothetical protein
MSDVIEYNIVLSIEEFKITIDNARSDPSLKAGSKSGKMILKRPIQNLNTYESAKSNFEKNDVKLKLYGDSMYNTQSAHTGNRNKIDIKKNKRMLNFIKSRDKVKEILLD